MLFVLIGVLAVPFGLLYHIQRRVQIHNYWKSTLESSGCRLSIREVDEGKIGYGLQLDEVTGVSALYWSPENEQKVLDGLNALGTVTRLSVGGNDFSEDTLRRLQDVPPLQRITFYSVGIRDFNALPPRVRMSVRALEINDQDSNIKYVAAIGDCQHLTELRLHSLKFDSRCEWLKQLADIETLSLYGSTGVSNLVPYLRASRITIFQAAYTDLQDASLAEVARSPALRTCIITDTPITDRGLEYFRGHPSLEELWIQYTNISDESISLFESLPSLRRLRLGGTRISQKAIDEFQSRHPEVEVDIQR